MKNNGIDGKETEGTSPSPATAHGESLKRAWQTPEMIEEDYRETEADAGSGVDGGLYS